MKKRFSIILSVLFNSGLQAQVQDARSMFLEDITGKPFLKMNTDGIEGSAFLWDEWMQGQVTFQCGKTARVDSIRFSPYNNLLYFSRNGEMLEFVEPIKEFEIMGEEKGNENKFLFRSGYPPVDKQTSTTFYHVVNDGEVQLLRLVQKTVEPYRQYNQSTVMKFRDRQYFYAFKEGQMSRVKKR